MDNISASAVINYLRNRNATIDFARDVLEVVMEDNRVVVKLTDKVSGGQAHHVSQLTASEFEATYGDKTPGRVLRREIDSAVLPKFTYSYPRGYSHG